MNFRDLVEQYPAILADRFSLSFSPGSRPAEIAAAFSRFGVVKLTDALPAASLHVAGESFRRFAGRHRPDQDHKSYTGSWYSPWLLREDDYFPAAAVISTVIRSWTWDIVEEICSSSNIVLILKWCTARHAIDAALGVGAHQDAKVVAPDVPFSIWVPLNPVVPGRTSGLGFVVPPPDGILPTLPHDDVGAGYVLDDPARLWIPAYALGDLSIHSRFSPHFTTGYGTATDRFSVEIRAMPRHEAPAEYLDVAASVSRRDGLPTIVETMHPSNDDASRFFASPDLVRVASPKLRTVIR